jgi:hypothetical protein
MQIERPPSENNAPKSTLLAEIAKLWKDRRRIKSVHVDLSTFENHPFINIRIWETGSDGIDRPTKAGVALGVAKLPELARALAKAEAKARELGLIDGEGGQ